MTRKSMSPPELTAVIPGTFDPITYGHLDIISRASQLFGRVVVAVYHHHGQGQDPLGKSTALPLLVRAELVQEASAKALGMHKIQVRTYHRLTVQFAAQLRPCVLIRGLRSVRDFEYESELLWTQWSLDPDIDTLFLRARPEHQHISSAMVRHLAAQQTFTTMVPPCVNEQLKSHYQAS